MLALQRAKGKAPEDKREKYNGAPHVESIACVARPWYSKELARPPWVSMSRNECPGRAQFISRLTKCPRRGIVREPSKLDGAVPPPFLGRKTLRPYVSPPAKSVSRCGAWPGRLLVAARSTCPQIKKNEIPRGKSPTEHSPGTAEPSSHANGRDTREREKD